MPSLATLSAGFVINDIPFEYIVGTDAHNEDRLKVWFLSVYWLSDTEEFYVADGQVEGYYDSVEEVIEAFKQMEGEIR